MEIIKKKQENNPYKANDNTQNYVREYKRDLKEKEGLSLYAKLFAMADDYKKGDVSQLEKINSSIDSYRIN